MNLKRLTIAVTDRCNLKCNYCMRKASIGNSYIEPSKEFLDYIENLTPYTKFVCLSGGEPLLRFDICKKIIERIPDGINRKIITNGILLNKEKVDYLNKHNVGIKISHDGEMTELARSVDILKDKEKISLLRDIPELGVGITITSFNFNTNIISYIDDKLKKEDIHPSRYYDLTTQFSILSYLNKNNLFLLQDKRCESVYKWYKPRLVYHDFALPIKVHLDIQGNIYTIIGQHKLGTIYDNIDTVNNNLLNIDYGPNNFCRRYKDNCNSKFCNNCYISYSSPNICEYANKLANGKLIPIVMK